MSNKEKKRKQDFLKKHGWVTHWSDDNWVRQRWIDEGKNVDWMGYNLNNAYEQCQVEIDQQNKGWFHENGTIVKKSV